MFGNSFVRRLAFMVVAMGAVLAAPSAVWAQARRQTKAATSAVFSEVMARAKDAGQPVVVFGVTQGCSRCAAFKQALATQPELQHLMTQYVSTEVPFGGPDFVAIFEDIVRQEAQYNQAIGTPSIFIFTAKGNVVYAGPNSPGGIQPDDEFKKLLLTGIEKNGVRGPAKSPPVASPQPKTAASRTWKSKSGQFSVTATLVSFNGKSAQLRTGEGKTITVALDVLSVEDQEFLKASQE